MIANTYRQVAGAAPIQSDSVELQSGVQHLLA
jgi:hypothetical protein